MGNKIYPIGVQNFEKLRTSNYYYVDKTEIIYRLVTSGSYYFLSRPRRFGKSLLISTLEAYFLGKKELFRGLAIEQLEQKWVKHPVLHLDLNTEQYDTPEAVANKLNIALKEWEKLYGSEEYENTLASRFEGVIQRAYEKSGERVVILVDEYDKPMLQAIGNEELQEDYRNTLKTFYGALKSKDACIRFALLSGVTKFGKVSVFSDLNNVTDISMWRQYVNICGITEEELYRDFDDELHALADSYDMTYEQMCREVKERYDGYHFCENSAGLYNPFSLLNTFASQKLGNYWFATGTPTYLVKLLRMHHYKLEEMTNEIVTEDVLNSIDSASTNPVPVIYQSGYLTIKSYDQRFQTYALGFPNKEVEEGFVRFLLPYYAPVQEAKTGFEILNFVSEIEQGRIDAFMRRLQSFFADTPYELVRDLELHYQNVLFIVTKLLGFYVEAEYHTACGRIDLLLQTEHYIYVMEFKLDGTAAEALQQIRDKEYAAPFATDARRLFRVGVNFSNRLRNIEEWIVE
ncbi:MAG: ATP-binding protein [Bacteroides sp.]|nr:ATP-binding protein [Bacteroides sp.]